MSEREQPATPLPFLDPVERTLVIRGVATPTRAERTSWAAFEEACLREGLAPDALAERMLEHEPALAGDAFGLRLAQFVTRYFREATGPARAGLADGGGPSAAFEQALKAVDAAAARPADGAKGSN